MNAELFLLLLIIAPTALVSIKAFKDRELFDKLKFNAAHIHSSKEWHRFFTHGFVHADTVHLLVNMFVLWSFGVYVLIDFHAYFGNLSNIIFLGLYFPALFFSSISSYIKHHNNVYYNAVGASGAVSAVVFASIILNPGEHIGLLFLPKDLIPSWLFGLLYLIYSAYMSKKEIDNIGHDAHFWGALYGVFFILATIPSSFIGFIRYFVH